jgi:hypothetical protein
MFFSSPRATGSLEGLLSAGAVSRKSTLQLSKSDFSDAFTEVRAGRVLVWLRSAYAPTLRDMGVSDPDAMVAGAGEDVRRFEGRGRPASIPIHGHEGERMVVRPYLHGGLFGALFRRTFLGPSRALREALLAEFALRRGVPTFTPLAAVTCRLAGLFYRAHLVSRELPPGLDLTAFLTAGPARKVRRRVLCLAGRAVRKMHDVGLMHADLHVKNLYVASPQGDPEVYILDWDLSTARERLTPSQRFRNLARLDRSGAKLARRGVTISAYDRVAFLRAYLGEDRDLLSARAFRRREFTWGFHALLWRLGDLF